MRSPTRAGAAALALALVGLALSTPSVEAQYNKTEPPKTRFRLGPLRFSPKLELRNAGRDSNVYLDPTNPLADTSVVLRGSVEGFVPVGRRVRLFGEGWLDWSYYQQQGTETSTDPGGEGRAEIDFGPFTFMGGGGALQARQLYSIDIDERILREERWVNAGAEWRLTRRFLVSGGVEERSFRFDPRQGLGVAASLNRNNLVGTLAARYKLTSMTTMVGTADVFQDDFQLSAPGLGAHALVPLPRRLRVRREGRHHRPLPRRHARLPGFHERQPAELSRPRIHRRSWRCRSSTACVCSARSSATSSSRPPPCAPPRSALATPTC